MILDPSRATPRTPKHHSTDAARPVAITPRGLCSPGACLSSNKSMACRLYGLLLLSLLAAPLAHAADWTVLVYLAADNDLESYALDDFLQMATVGSTDRVNVVVQFDRSQGYVQSYGDWTTCKRFRITAGMTPTADNALSDLGEPNTGDPQVLTDFLAWGKASYPADRYAVILWNHGGGWRSPAQADRNPTWKGIAWDEDPQAKGDCLLTAELRTAFDQSGLTPDLVGFDACLMGMVEVAYELSRLQHPASVMVASPEVIPGEGWPYDTLLADLVAHPGWDAATWGAAITDRYFASYCNNQVLSTIDLSRMGSLAAGIDQLAAALSSTDQTAARAAATTVRATLSSAVLHEHHGPSWPGATGLAIYFPGRRETYDPDYDTATCWATEHSWDDLLRGRENGLPSFVDVCQALAQSYYTDQNLDLSDLCRLILDPPPPPSNDAFIQAMTIDSVLPAQSDGISYQATAESNEPLHCGYQARASVWWSWTSPVSGPVAISTLGSDFDTLLDVFTGDSLGSLVLVAANDGIDWTRPGPSLAVFLASAGTTYHIAVDGKDGETGTVALTLAMPMTNDAFADALELTGRRAIAEGHNHWAMAEPGEPAYDNIPFPTDPAASVWWRWTAPADGQVQLSTAGSDLDTILAVYEGEAIGALTLVAINDDARLGDITSQVRFPVVAGHTYRIAVDGYDGDRGQIHLVLRYLGTRTVELRLQRGSVPQAVEVEIDDDQACIKTTDEDGRIEALELDRRIDHSFAPYLPVAPTGPG